MNEGASYASGSSAFLEGRLNTTAIFDNFQHFRNRFFTMGDS